MARDTSFVTFDNVCKYYQMGDTRIAAADHVSFEIEKGEFCVILGPSGAGKTTVLNMLGGMDTCDEGTIILDGEKVSDFNARRLTEYRRYDVGFVFQFYNLVQNLTARENVELASEIFKLPARIGFPEALPGLDRSYINPKYTTVLGLLKSEAKKIATSSSSSGRSEREKSSLGGRLKGFFGKLF